VGHDHGTLERCLHFSCYARFTQDINTMRTEIIHCDICRKELPQRGWEDTPTRLVLTTFCMSQNPMSEHAKGFQDNTFISEETCESCQRTIAGVLAVTLTKLKPNGTDSVTHNGQDQRTGRANLR